MIEAGLGDRLMRDWWEEDDGSDLPVLSPASIGFEGKRAPEFGIISIILGVTKGCCTFLTDDERCEIHTSGFKPQECRHAFGCTPGENIHEKIADSWRGEDGRAVVALWDEGRKNHD